MHSSLPVRSVNVLQCLCAVYGCVTTELHQMEVATTSTSQHSYNLVCLYIVFIDSEVLIHFDGWGDGYDYWCPPDAVELHPPGWCERNYWELQTPRGNVWECSCCGMLES